MLYSHEACYFTCVVATHAVGHHKHVVVGQQRVFIAGAYLAYMSNRTISNGELFHYCTVPIVTFITAPQIQRCRFAHGRRA
jgi:hypothetical protein